MLLVRDVMWRTWQRMNLLNSNISQHFMTERCAMRQEDMSFAITDAS